MSVLSNCHYRSHHTGIIKLEWWVEAGLGKDTRGERRFYDHDLGAESDRNEAWRPMSEVVSKAVLWLDSRTYQGMLGEFSLVKNVIGANFGQ